MNRMFKFSFAVTSMLALGALAAPAVAASRTEPANIGMPYGNVSISLFTSRLGAITYNGSGYAWWEIPLVADQAQPFPTGFPVLITGFAPSRDQNLKCATRLVDADGVTFSGTNVVQIPFVDSLQTWTPGTVGPLTLNGSVVVDCEMGTGAWISNVQML